MQGKSVRVHTFIAAALGLVAGTAAATEDLAAPPPVAIVVSVKDQRLALLERGGLVKRYPISTSKFGLGDRFGSYMTPLGRHRVCDKIGDGLPLGAVMKHRNATGEILPVNAPGRDPIVTRILWLEGLEARNSNARSRGIYIHGTVEEGRVGDPVSYGCIRMRSRDVAELFAAVPVGTPVEIIEGRLPRFPKPGPAQPEVLIVKRDAAAAERPAATLAVAPRAAEKSRATSAVFGERIATTKSAAAPSSGRESWRGAKVPSGAVLLAEGREVAAGGAGDSQRRIEVSMKKSILFAGLPEIAAAPVNEPEAEKRRTR